MQWNESTIMEGTDWKNRVALVTGGLGDIGQAVVNALERKGVRVAVGDLSEAPPAHLQKSTLLYTRVDVCRKPEVVSWFKEVEKAFGCPDIIVLNAAIVEPGTASDCQPDSWERTIGVNLMGAVNVAQVASRRMMDTGTRGNIVAMGSWAAHAPHPGLAAYSVSKAALRMFCKCLALDLAPHGITVNELAPGYVDAGLSAQVWKEDPASRQEHAAKVPTGELLEVDEVARALISLCSPEFSHMTGSVVLLDGGLSLLQGPS